MLLHIPDVLTPAEPALAAPLLRDGEWVDGRVTAGHQSTRVKDNAQLPEGSPATRQFGGTGHRIRTDPSAPLFPGDPAGYDGGEWTVEDTCGVRSIKLPPGHLVLYPANLDTGIQRPSADHPDHPPAVLLTGVYHNLLRRGAER